MKIKQSLIYGFLAAIFALALGACSAAKGQRLTGTDSFNFIAINNGTAYSVSAGTATEGVVNIPAYYRPDSKSAYLPVIEINDEAFRDCADITVVTIPKGVKKIGIRAFLGCKNLTAITIPTSVTEIGIAAFAECTDLTDITIPKGVTSISDQTFYECIGLTAVTIPAGVTSIGFRAFYYCISLTAITIPADVTSIDAGAFAFCESLAAITIPDSVTSIGNNAFGFCIGIPVITIPAGVIDVGLWPFRNWTASQTINIHGHSSEAAADRAWGASWRENCNAVINYLGK